MNKEKTAILLLIIWWGAFTFYAGVVIPIGSKVLGSHTPMGFITQAVTVYFNYLALSIFIFFTFAFRKVRWTYILGILLILGQISLFFWHYKLDPMLNFKTHEVVEKQEFYALHRVYLLTSSVIWLIVSGVLFKNIRFT
ncbi:hypothetical protein [Emticicia oligotrophica]|nr:hypothetical protein [Emticicia oligotrophica]